MDMLRESHGWGYPALRLGRCSLEGDTYLVTFSAAGRRPLFNDFLAASLACRCIVDGRIWLRSRLLAWVLMPDYWHGIIQLGSTDDLSVLINRLKTNSSRVLRRELPGLGRIWSTGFDDKRLRRDEDLEQGLRHILAAPIRANLADAVADYPFWDAVWLRDADADADAGRGTRPCRE